MEIGSGWFSLDCIDKLTEFIYALFLLKMLPWVNSGPRKLPECSVLDENPVISKGWQRQN